MKYVHRQLETQIRKAIKAFPAVVLTGPRRAGKTFLLRHLFPKASYFLLEDPDIVSRIRSDPRGFLAEIQLPTIIDEIQNAPTLIPYIRTLIDQAPKKQKGQWLLTGSQEAPLMQGVTESLAGRAALFQLLPLSYREWGSWNLLKGGFPEVLSTPRQASIWFSSYLQTYLERDVRAITAVKDLPTFRRFLSLLASRHGQIVNKTDLATPLGVSVPTIGQWLDILEITGQIIVVPPFYNNFGKRLIKSPKIYWLDSGLVSFLLGISSAKMLEQSPFLGTIFEGFIASEMIKNQINQGKRKELYYFRDQQGLEVDFIIPAPNGSLIFVEAKASYTVGARTAKPLTSIISATQTSSNNDALRMKKMYIVVHRKHDSSPDMQSIAPQIKALSVEEFLGSDIF